MSDDHAEKTGLEKALYLSAMFDITQDRVSPGNIEWFAAARTARREQPDALQGFHNSNLVISEDDVARNKNEGSGGALMFVIEEASGVPDEVFLPVEGALTSAGSRLIMVGNPTRNDGFFAKSHTSNRRDFTTLHFPVSGSPLAKPGYREGLVRRYGEGSNVVRVRADGDFPKHDDDVLIALEWGEAMVERDPQPILDPRPRRILGIDVARYGSDRTVFLVREGPAILHIEVRAKEDTMQSTGRAVDIARQFNVDDIMVDVIGVGSGVVDRLTELAPEHGWTITGVNVADAATARPKTRDKSANIISEHRFGKQDMTPHSMKEYLWLEMSDWFQYDEPYLRNGTEFKDHAEELVAECATVRYRFNSQGRILVESKDSMKERGLDSPDYAEALAMTFAPDRLSLWERLGG